MEAQIATTSCPLLARFNAAGVLKPGDVHVATRVAAMVGEERPEARLMLALITKGLRDGSVCVDLATVPEGPHDPATRDWDITPEAWPHAQWPTVLETSPLTTTNPAVVRLHNNRAYAHRYWDEETHVLNALVTRLETSDTSKDVSQVSATYFPDPTYADQARAARLATSRSLAIITGGPGSGKTTTLARILGMLLETTPDVRIGLGAPTGKAAARMVQALSQATTHATFPPTHAQRIADTPATTLHRLLGYAPGRGFRYDEHNPLPYDVVVVDEASMVSLPLMAHLLRAMRSQTRLVLVGDANQLASVEAGVVFADLVEGLVNHPLTPVAQLGPSRRFGHHIHALAEDIRMGEAEAVAHALNAAGTQDSVAPIGPDELLETLIPHARAMAQAARHGDSHTALGLLAAQQVLCAHREGPYGVRTWNQAIAARIHPGGEDWFAGQPVLVTRNDHALRLFNGDHGVVVNRDGRFVVAFDHGEGVREIPLSRLSDIVPAYAITIHRAQGSQFDTVYVVLPPQDSPLLTRELFYTAVTRASQRVRVIAAPGSVEAAITRHVNRASGLAQRLSHGEG